MSSILKRYGLVLASAAALVFGNGCASYWNDDPKKPKVTRYEEDYDDDNFYSAMDAISELGNSFGGMNKALRNTNRSLDRTRKWIREERDDMNDVLMFRNQHEMQRRNKR